MAMNQHIGTFSTLFICGENHFLVGQSDILLYSMRSWDVSDTRDAIYSLLGLPAMQKDLPIIPDYNIEPLRLFKDVVVTYINTTRKLTLLRHVNHWPDEGQVRNTPSWVPLWNTASSTSHTLEDRCLNPTIIKDWPLIADRVSDIEGVLSLEGSIADEIDFVSSSLRFENLHGSENLKTFSPLVSLWDHASLHGKTTTDQDADFMTALAVAMTGNVGIDILPANRDVDSLALHLSHFKTAMLHCANLAPLRKCSGRPFGNRTVE